MMDNLFGFDVLSVGMSRYPLVTGAAVFFLVASSITFVLNRPRKPKFPVVEIPDGSLSCAESLIEGLSKYPDTPFILPLKRSIVILPGKVLEEVRNLPEEQLSFNKDILQSFAGWQTGVGQDRPEGLLAIKNDLTKNLGSTLDPMQDEVRYALNTELGPCEDWKSFVLYPKLARVVALLSGRIFVGEPLCRSEEWIEASINYTMDILAVMHAMAKWPVFMRRTVAPFLPEVKRVKQYATRGAQLLDPILKANLANAYSEKKGLKHDAEQGTFISWVLNHTKEGLRDDPEHLAEAQMILSFAAIHTTTAAASQAVFDLVSHREYIQPLRDEIQQVIDEDGKDVDGEGFLKLKKNSMAKLRKLDSFLKESQRLSPPGLISMSRRTVKPLALSTGHTIPTNTRIAFASHAIHQSVLTPTYSPAYNPAINKPPAEFDGFRFFNLRAMEGKETKHQFVTTSADSLVWGHGSHACPGRFFASNEIKVVLIEMLRSWDFRLKGDVELKGGERPKSFEVDAQVAPNHDAEIEFKRRVV